jgi:hypothetical protein
MGALILVVALLFSPVIGLLMARVIDARPPARQGRMGAAA